MPKQQNESEIDYKTRVLDRLSPSFCGAKWYNATIWLGSGMTTSCHHPPAHKIPIELVKSNPKVLHNTDQKKQDRAMMQQGERPRGCEYCWKLEDMDRPAVSDRFYKSVIYTDTELENAHATPALEDINLKTLEVSFDRTCQFACSYCNPAFSTTWAKDISTNGPYVGLVSDGRNHFTHPHNSSQLYSFTEVNPYVEAFFKWWETDLHKTLTELRITGGEPLMSGHTWKLLDWFQQNKGQSKTRLAINSNLGVDRTVIDRLLEKTQGVELDVYTSQEAFFEQAEYIRDGLDWNQWMDNLMYLCGKGIRGVHVMCTINSLCLGSIEDLLSQLVLLKKEFRRNDPTFTLNILRFPSFQSPLVLPLDMRQGYANSLTMWKISNIDHLHGMEVAHIERLVHYLTTVVTPHSEAFELPKLQNDFKKFYEQYDVRRGKNFRVAFPDLEAWYDSL